MMIPANAGLFDAWPQPQAASRVRRMMLKTAKWRQSIQNTRTKSSARNGGEEMASKSAAKCRSRNNRKCCHPPPISGNGGGSCKRGHTGQGTQGIAVRMRLKSLQAIEDGAGPRPIQAVPRLIMQSWRRSSRTGLRQQFRWGQKAERRRMSRHPLAPPLERTNSLWQTATGARHPRKISPLLKTEWPRLTVLTG